MSLCLVCLGINSKRGTELFTALTLLLFIVSLTLTFIGPVEKSGEQMAWDVYIALISRGLGYFVWFRGIRKFFRKWTKQREQTLAFLVDLNDPTYGLPRYGYPELFEGLYSLNDEDASAEELAKKREMAAAAHQSK